MCFSDFAVCRVAQNNTPQPLCTIFVEKILNRQNIEIPHRKNDKISVVFWWLKWHESDGILARQDSGGGSGFVSRIVAATVTNDDFF